MTMEEVRGTTNLMRLVDRLRAEMTRTYYDENDERMKTKRPTILLRVGDYYHSWFGARMKIEITLTQLRSVLEQQDNHCENESEAWMKDPHYIYKVTKMDYSNEIRISSKFSYTDKRIMGDEGSYIGYKDSDGRTVLWEE